jgi:hypothetical protein
MVLEVAPEAFEHAVVVAANLFRVNVGWGRVSSFGHCCDSIATDLEQFAPKGRVKSGGNS